MRSKLSLHRKNLTLQILFMCLSTSSVVLGQQGGALTPDDLFSLERVSSITIAPTADVFAFARRRPYGGKGRKPGKSEQLPEVLVAPIGENAELQHITRLESNDAPYLQWSPDGRRLAMATSKGDPVWRLRLWARSTQQVTEVPVTLIEPWDFAWVDNNHLVALIWPDDGPPRWGQRAAIEAWQRQRDGRVSTVDVLESGGLNDIAKLPYVRIVLVDVNSRAVQTLDRAPRFRDLRVSPDSRHVAVLKRVSVYKPSPTLPLPSSVPFEWDSYQVTIADVNGTVVSVKEGSASPSFVSSFLWSLDGSAFTFLGKSSPNDKDFRLFRGSVGGEVEVIPIPGSPQIKKLIWGAGERLFIAAEQEVSVDGNPSSRLDWWLVSPKSAIFNITEQLSSPPTDLLAVSQGKFLVGTKAGALWRLDVERGFWANVTSSLGQKIDGISWPTDEVPLNDRSSQFVIVSVSQGDVTDYYRVDFLSGFISRIERTSDSARIVGYNARTDTAIFVANETVGTFLTTVHQKTVISVVGTNKYLGHLRYGQCQSVNYRSLEGGDLKGWVILPSDYQIGRRYPLVVWVYGGQTYNQKPPSECHINNSNSLTPQLLAARGYAVLLPSMPLAYLDGKTTSQTEPYSELSNGVLPAIDKVIELGIADSKRLAVMGHSYGGYSTYGLVTQTNRFKAAISSSGISNLFSEYGTFFPVYRYGEDPRVPSMYIAHMGSERGQLRMGVPPWKDSNRYLRNSPLFYADRVQTPLLIIQGDMDSVGITQGEEFFTALYRQGKRARFARYWGEGHVLESNANIRDMWAQIFSWLDEFCDLSRDSSGNLKFHGELVLSRAGAEALKPNDFERFTEIELRSHPRDRMK